ncbi:hypothetical protein Hanom_Chr12g01078411 [Helianthus anomalus]
MHTKAVSLSLNQISRQPLSPISVEIRKARRHTRSANTRINSQTHNSSPRRLSLDHFFSELRVHQKVSQFWVPVIRLLDAVQEYGSNDAPTFPDSRQLTELQVPSLFIALRMDQVHPLCVTAYFCCV